MAKAVNIPCPICKRISSETWRPFCSRRCSDIDLGRWLGEVYRVPGEEEERIEIDGINSTTDED